MQKKACVIGLTTQAKSLIAFFLGRSLWKVPYPLDVSHVESLLTQTENIWVREVQGGRKEGVCTRELH